jgi:RNA polymerase sigma factor (sigma-70 family)
MGQPETRPSLIVRLKDQRNEPAWVDFLRAYEPFLIQLVRRRGTPERHVADVTQQLLIAIAQSVGGWSDDGKPASFRRWLSRVARNVVIKFMIRERRQVSGQGGTGFLEQLQRVPDTAESEEHAGQYEHELIVWAAEQVRGDFRETSWKAFWATQIEGRTVADVAAELGVSPGSIYMSRSRILARIRAKIYQVMENEE